MDDINKEIYELGKLCYSPQDVAIIQGMTEEELQSAMLDRDSVFFRSYHKGYYETDIKVRDSILKLAAAGSSPAQTMALNLMKLNKINNS